MSWKLETQPARRPLALTLAVTLAAGLAGGTAGSAHGQPAVGGGVGGGSGWGGSGAAPSVVSGSHREERRERESYDGRGTVLSLLGDAAVTRELALDAQQKARVGDILRTVLAGESNLRSEAMTGARMEGERILAAGSAHDAELAELRREGVRVGDEIEALLDPAQRRMLAQWRAADRAAAPASGGAATTSASRFGGSTARGTTNAVSGGGGYSSAGDPGSVVRAIRRPDASRVLKLTPEQDAAVADLLGKFAAVEAGYRDRFAARMQARGQSARERHQGRAEAVVKAREAAERGTREALGVLTAPQRRRLDELTLQLVGTEGLLRPEVVAALRLSATQQARLGALRQETKQQVDALLQPTPGRPFDHGLFARADAIRRSSDQRMLTTVLTPQQRDAWQRLQGRPFPGLERLRAGGGGGGGGTTLNFGSGGQLGGGGGGGLLDP